MTTRKKGRRGILSRTPEPVIVDHAEQIAELRERIAAQRVVAPPPAPDRETELRRVAEMAAAAAREGIEAAAAAAARSRQEGGPCMYCGSRSSAGWHGREGRLTCDECNDDLGWYTSDDDRKCAVLRRQFTERERHGWVGRDLIERSGFKWFHESTAVATYGKPWEYLTTFTRRAIVTRLTPDDVTPPHDEFCRRCGCDNAWEYGLSRGVVKEGRSGDPVKIVYEGVGWRCHACVGVDVEDAARALAPECGWSMTAERGNRLDRDACNRAGIVYFTLTDDATRRDHDPSRPYSWLTPERIRTHLKPRPE